MENSTKMEQQGKFDAVGEFCVNPEGQAGFAWRMGEGEYPGH